MGKKLSVTLIMALALTAASGAVARESCETYPAAVQNQIGGLSGCELKEAGERPLWRGLPKDAVQITRFVLTDGHSLFWTAVTITEDVGGTAILKVSGIERRSNYRSPTKSRSTKRIRLSAEEVARINDLGAKAGNWEFETGSWDGDDIYVHCQFLEMERVNAEGYRYSSVNISCNRPAKLMPLVEEVARLAKLKMDGLIYY